MSLLTGIEGNLLNFRSRFADMLTLEFQIVCRPALLESHNIGHRLASAEAGVSFGEHKPIKHVLYLPFLEIPNVVPFRS